VERVLFGEGVRPWLAVLEANINAARRDVSAISTPTSIRTPSRFGSMPWGWPPTGRGQLLEDLSGIANARVAWGDELDRLADARDGIR
jgi:hypothetical protein